MFRAIRSDRDGSFRLMKILLGITGSVSAYKTPWLVRDLRRGGHDVRVIMTPSAREFVAPLALEAVSTHPVIINPYDPTIQEGGSWHVHLAHWADVICIAPCSATTLARLAAGLCDTALMTVVCSRPAATPLVVFPAMDTDMWHQAATQRNVAQLRSDGITVVEPDSGPLASGLTGAGRLPEIGTITSIIAGHDMQGADHAPDHDLAATTSVSGKHLVITAGPTHERIDAVRSIVNHSTGTMGFALAAAAQRRGYLVTLIAGPVALPTPHGLERIDVVSAADMYNAVMQHRNADVFIMSAAVADFTPSQPHDQKLKKDSVGDELTLHLRRTTDILAELGAAKQSHQRVVGFALETGDVVAYATEKLAKKKADMIVANAADAPDSGFGPGRNTITIITNHGSPSPFPPMSKTACAEVILDAIERL
ncbi:MAG TPA: bifunctional phosphopantothenoylcysteine decarboxylase/phosphopantothenate--cysteine ligase CoaBC [Bacteroidetes bacterium]|nr:bifunctional phosphopantothenoylcysteine decarboxylase/phosphopantothenate--cysteine ligase CoaBC [Bacteroidota bacterium]